MDIIDTFTKKQISDESVSNIVEHFSDMSTESIIKIVGETEDNATLIESLKKLLGPLNLDEESLSQVIISALPKIPTTGPQGASGPQGVIGLPLPSTGPQGPIQPPINEGYIVHDPSKYVIVNGPDGEQYYTDNTGLFINVKDVKVKAGYAEQMPAESIVQIVARDSVDGKGVGVEVCWNEDDTKIIATVTVPEGVSVESVNKKSIFEHFTLLEVDSFSLSEVCTLTYSTDDMPTCLFYTAKASEENLVPSSFYRFDRPSKFHSSCSNELVVKESADTNPSCMYDSSSKGTFTCPKFIQNSWEDSFLTQDKEGKNVVIQSRRYGLGHLKWRAVEQLSNEVVAESNGKEGFDSFVSSIDEFLGELTEINTTKQETLTQDKVYTNHVANALN